MSEGKELYLNPIKISITWGLEGDGGGTYLEIPPVPTRSEIRKAMMWITQAFENFRKEEDE